MNAQVKAEIVRIMREEFDPQPPNYGGYSWHDGAEEAADLIMALFPAPPVGSSSQYKVKALEWKLSRAAPEDPETGHYGHWVGGWYLVSRERRNTWGVGTHDPRNGQWRKLGLYPSRNEAKAAAQADYEARIRSTFEGSGRSLADAPSTNEVPR